MSRINVELKKTQAMHEPLVMICVQKRSLRRAVRVLRLFSNQHTLEICYLLDARKRLGIPRMCVTDIWVEMGIVQTDASFALAKLRKIGVVTAARNGKRIEYTLNKKRFNYLLRIIRGLSELYDETSDEGQTHPLLAGRVRWYRSAR